MKLVLISFLFVAIPSNDYNLFANGVLECTEEEGGGFCPDDNTCCRVTANHKSDHSSSSSSSCITSALKGGKGSCCSDDGIGNTGCGHGYRCAVENSDDGSELFRYCELIPEEEEERNEEEEEEEDDDEKLGHRPKKKKEKLAEILPRYNLCSLPRSSLEEVHGLPVPRNSQQQREGIDDSDDVPPLLAYYSNKGDITSSSLTTNEDIKMAVIIIHGSARNADDYICSMSGALQHDLQKAYDPESEVLLLAPRFLAPEDGVVELTNNNSGSNGRIEQPLRWSSGDPNSSYIRWTWRYGADSIPNQYNGEGGGISSFRAVDAMVEFLADNDRNRFPNLERVVVVGHSAGGQFAHRWALTSMSSVWEDDGDRDRVDVIAHEQTSVDAQFIRKRSLSSRSPSSSVSIRAVASNPRSFTYVNNKRFIGSTFQIPSQQDLDRCPSYDDWQWGFDTNVIGSIVAPYKDAAIAHAGGLDHLVRRYARRNVLYVAGALDTEHILGTCEDSYQGVNRFERSDLFYRSLQDHLGNEDEDEHGDSLERYQTRMVVDDVGHDHALIFQSQAGIQAVFE